MEAPPIQVLDFHNVHKNRRDYQEEESKNLMQDTSRVDRFY